MFTLLMTQRLLGATSGLIGWENQKVVFLTLQTAEPKIKTQQPIIGCMLLLFEQIHEVCTPTCVFTATSP